MAKKTAPTAFDEIGFLRIISAKRVNLLLKYPFFGTLAMYLQPIICNETVTQYIATDGHSLFLNPQGLAEIHPRMWEGVIAHEVLHAALNHCSMQRKQQRDVQRWNIACDISVNGMIDDEHLELPTWAVRNKQLAHLPVEAIYAALPTDQKQDPRNADIKPSSGQNNEDLDAVWKERIVSAYEVAKQAGKASKSQARLANVAKQQKVDWKTALAQFLTPREPTTDNWNRPSRRSIAVGAYLPSKNIEFCDLIVIVVDTSASVTTGELSQFQAEVASIQQQFRPNEILVMYVDYKLNGVESFTPDTPVVMHPKGGGGTAFAPAFAYINKHQLNPECLVYLTDGEATFDDIVPPDYPVLWAITSQSGITNINPPFGEQVVFKFD